MNTIQEKVSAYENTMKSMNIWEYNIESYTNNILTISGAMDFAYYHEVELYFKGVAYISAPTIILNTEFRLGTEEEKKEILKDRSFPTKDYQNVFAFCNDADDPDDIIGARNNKFYIIASDFDYKIGNVYYYKREDLKEGERIADWVFKADDKSEK